VREVFEEELRGFAFCLNGGGERGKAGWVRAKRTSSSPFVFIFVSTPLFTLPHHVRLPTRGKRPRGAPRWPACNAVDQAIGKSPASIDEGQCDCCGRTACLDVGVGGLARRVSILNVGEKYVNFEILARMGERRAGEESLVDHCHG